MQFQRPALVQEQRLKMNPMLYQSIKLMEVPAADLRELIAQEVERNPALEVVSEPALESLDSVYRSSRRKEEDAYFESTSDAGFLRASGQEASDRKQQFIEGALTRPETLQEHLLWQLRLEPIPEDLRRMGELIIGNLDGDGFHREPVKELLRGEAPRRVTQALRRVQALDPQGCGTADYREALRVQARLLGGGAQQGMAALVDHLESLERGKFAEVARLLGRPEEEVRSLFDALRALSPYPGRRFDSTEKTRFVTADVRVIRKEGGFAIVLNHEEIPVLGISPFFMKLEEGKPEKNGDSARDFARENLREARWFMQCITQRNHTLLRVSRAIVRFQRAFFLSGPKYIVPLTLRDIAETLSVHEATVSRTANGKYMQTEWGIFEIRHFFTNSISGRGSGGSRFSKQGVKEMLREIIDGAGRKHSDQELADILAGRGIKLARRTVAKYRHELELGPSYGRAR